MKKEDLYKVVETLDPSKFGASSDPTDVSDLFKTKKVLQLDFNKVAEVITALSNETARIADELEKMNKREHWRDRQGEENKISEEELRWMVNRHLPGKQVISLIREAPDLNVALFEDDTYAYVTSSGFISRVYDVAPDKGKPTMVTTPKMLEELLDSYPESLELQSDGTYTFEGIPLEVVIEDKNDD